MNGVTAIKNDIRNFIAMHQIAAVRVWTGILTFVSLTCVNICLGYQNMLDHWYIVLLISVLCAFLPLSGASIIVMLFTMVNLLSLALDVSIVACILTAISFMVCAYFRSRNIYNLAIVPVSFGMHIPNIIAVGSGLFRSINELASVLCGGVLAYYLNVVRLNSSTILDETSDVGAFELLKTKMLLDPLFYFYIVALAAGFLICYGMRQLKIKHSWTIASIVAVIVSSVIMLIGYTVTDAKGFIGWLLLGSLINIVVGFLLDFFFRDLDATRLEKLQFEDDDYYYYVTAVPKLKFTKEEKKIKRF